MNLPEAVLSLRNYSIKNGFNPFEVMPPSREFTREVDHEGGVYRVCLTRLALTMRPMLLLSVSKLNGEPNEHGALLPSAEEGAEIARAFFPRGCTALPDDLDALKFSRKYLAFE